MRTHEIDSYFPELDRQETIPRIIHQTYPTRDLPEQVQQNVDRLRRNNPAWIYKFYDDAGIEAFILKEYGQGMLSDYLQINPRYGAARADLFRYLVIYKLGGVYLDIKSSFIRPIDQVLHGNEQYIISYWDNAQGERYEGYGIHPELASYPRGEIQQWHVIAAPGHPFLRAMIVFILETIEKYSPWRTGVGKAGVLRLTGPIAYTKVLTPLLGIYKHREVRNQSELFLEYSFLAGHTHEKLFKTHYTTFDEPLVNLHGAAFVSARLYVYCRRMKYRARATAQAATSRLRDITKLSSSAG